MTFQSFWQDLMMAREVGDLGRSVSTTDMELIIVQDNAKVRENATTRRGRVPLPARKVTPNNPSANPRWNGCRESPMSTPKCPQRSPQSPIANLKKKVSIEKRSSGAAGKEAAVS